MGTLETLAMCCVYVGFFMVFFTICAGINWILGKIGFLHWLRGWLWYLGLIDERPDKKRNR
jgi:hypothetical protein